MLSLLVGACFFVSGAAGLAYENVWMRQVGLACGNTVTATTVVLAAFMGGLALGSAIAGRLGDRIERPLRAYGWLELAVAVAAFAFPWALERVRPLPPGLQLAAVTALLAVPATLMGATLPLLVRFAAGASRGRALGWLYAVNNAGAVAGSLITGFFLIRALGLFATSFLAQAANVVVGLAAIVADGWAPDAPVVTGEAQARGDAEPGAALVLPCVLASGFAAMLYEVALMKLLPLVLGASVHAFCLMTAAFIAGIALGAGVAGLAAPWVGRRVAALGWVELAAGLAFLLALPLVNHLPALYAWLRGGATSFAGFQLVSLALCFAVMLVPAMALGAVLPIAAEATAGTSVAGAVGRLYAVNTAGNIAGTLVTGLVLVPWIGFKGAMEVGVLLNLAAGVALLAASRPPGTTAGFACAAVVVSLYVLAYPSVDYLALTAGAFRTGEVASPGRVLKFAREDATGFVTVEEQPAPRRTLSLRVNGKVDASDGGDMLTQRLVAHLPLTLHLRPRDVYLIGLGSGVTAASALAHPVERVEVAELSPAVVEAARLFAHKNRNVLDHPGLALAVDDGRIRLERSARKYDVIISEPSNPWLAGITNLFSLECFALIRDHLAAGGLVAQWIHTYELDPETFRLVLRTFRKVFPFVRAYACLGADVVLLGSMEPFPDDFERLKRAMAVPAVAADLAEVGVATPLHLLMHYVAEGRELALFAGAGPLNSDDWPILEHAAPRALFTRQQTPLPDWETRAHAPDSLLRRYVDQLAPGPAVLRDLADHAAQDAMPDVAIQLLRDALRADPADVAARAKLAEHLARANQREAAAAEIEEAARRAPADLAVQRRRAELAFRVEEAQRSLLAPRRYPRALEAARAAVALAPKDAAVRATLAGILYDRGDWAEAEAAYRETVRLGGDAPIVRLAIASCRLRQKDMQGARAAFREAEALPGDVPEAQRELVRRLIAELEFKEAVR